MISIRICCTNIYPPITKTYLLQDCIDETIFFNTFRKICIKIDRKLCINLDECLWFYSAYIIKEIRNGCSESEIIKSITKYLSPDKLIIGVEDFLKEVHFDIRIDNIVKLKLELTNIFSYNSCNSDNKKVKDHCC